MSAAGRCAKNNEMWEDARYDDGKFFILSKKEVIIFSGFLLIGHHTNMGRWDFM